MADFQPPFEMTGAVVVILGAGPGIGAATAEIVAAAGAHVACVDIDLEVARQTEARVSATGGKATAHAADVLDRAQVREVLATIADTNARIDGVVNVVGRGVITHALDVTDDVWAQQFDINLRHQFIATQEAAPHLTRTKGAYVAITSMNGLVSSPHMIAYGAAKAALNSMIRTFAVELGPQGVRCNAIAPGVVRTPHADEIGITSGPLGQSLKDHTPLRELALPHDVGGAAFFLLSPLGRHITGQVLVVDGGSSANYFLPQVPVQSLTVPVGVDVGVHHSAGPNRLDS